MTATYDPELCARLVAEARDDDERMTPVPWRYDHDGYIESMNRGINHSGSETEVLTLGARNEPGDGDGVARTRNNLAAMADQLEAARAEVERLRRESFQEAATTLALSDSNRAKDDMIVRFTKNVEHWRREAERAADEPAERSRAVSEVHRMRPVVEAAEAWRDACTPADFHVTRGSNQDTNLSNAIDAWRSARDKCGICGAQITNLGITCSRGCPADDGRGLPRNEAGS